uniref:PHLPP-like RA domain-containing protein n=1 Tax=Acrobeloides nanus TaxID=290746 RepID=A0A914EMX4_9BILA
MLTRSSSDPKLHRSLDDTGQRSLTIPLTTQTTVRDVCQSFKLQSIFFQTGNQHIRQLSAESRPLQVQNEILLTLGYHSVEECLQIGDASHLKHIFCFYIGSSNKETASSATLGFKNF